MLNGNWKKENVWFNLVSEVSQIMGLSEMEKKKLFDSLTAELIAAIAFLSKCKNPERQAISHLLIFVAASIRKSEIYNHHLNESIRDRLLPIFYYPEGIQEIISAGINLLEIASLNDHKTDYYEDITNSKYNPLQKLNFKIEYEKLNQEYNSHNEEVKKIYSEFYERIAAVPWWL